MSVLLLVLVVVLVLFLLGLAHVAASVLFPLAIILAVVWLILMIARAGSGPRSRL